ncbi:uncharacterized protein F4807DRAFT_417054 [Annulohypoxylon truncatum]|uniref:uncharacterized protein n=1 Tax=Annulohypoxylon truncatum TaxID=327061 RepID=UPI0020088B95|nr:uncharacterized protein F4807DRAFT_417054 [Annulohypoxylon truncatum]KAI1211958.1 hypothetical protein F4807DRAFT_417054 [Annulohypoxylon truncatum]
MMSAQLQQPGQAGAQLAASENKPSDTTILSEAEQRKYPETTPLRNRALESKSPYVRAHADSLVAWQLLDDDAVSRAKRENKLIFLSIGFLASHHCYLTRQESFCNPKVALILNDNFVPIVIDREERPDIDNIYMCYNQSLSGSGGWPLNVFLTPELEPVFSGTYWAAPGVQDDIAVENDGVEKPLDWIRVITKVLATWLNEEPRVRDEAKKMVIELSHISAEGTLNHAGDDFLHAPFSSTHGETDVGPVDYSREVIGEVDLDQIEEAYERITRTFDPMCGGFGLEDKFPTSAKLSLLLRATQFPKVVQDVVGPNDCSYISGMGLHTLRRIATGAVHDHIGGGFHRYSVTRDWSLPAFEKMLIDNVLLLGLFLDAWLLSGGTENDEFADVVIEVADYLVGDRMLSQKGGFFTSEAADSYNRKGDKVMRNGAYYMWTRKEFDHIINDEHESEIAAMYWNVQEHGNVDRNNDPHDDFLNQNVLQIVKNSARLSQQLGIPEREVEDRIESAKAKLRSYRHRERVQPEVDTKIVTAYNGMAIAGLTRTALALLHTDFGMSKQGQKYLEVAKKAALFVKNELWDKDKKILYRVYSDGRTNIEAFAEDYALLIEGLIELYEGTAEESWLEWADELQALQIKLFYDHPTPAPTTANARCGAFYSTVLDAPYTLLRIKDAMDTSQPSVNAVSVSNLFRLGGLLGDDKYTYLAKESVNAFGVEMLEHPNLFPGLLCGIIPWKLGGKHWLVVGEKHDRAQFAAFYTLPRAALFTLRHHTPGKSDSWLAKRDAKTAALPQEPGFYEKSSDGTYRRLDSSDLVKQDGRRFLTARG